MTERNFTDYIKIIVTSGNGGKGSTHMRREKFVPKGGPDGGNGGNGGNVIVIGNKQFWTLYHFKFKRHFKAEHGGDGGKSHSSGHQGESTFIEVPLGSIIKDSDTGEVIGEIYEDQQEIIVEKGGKGGRGNSCFKSPINQTPKYSQPGIPGKTRNITIELKILADVGLVGFPNAGKSTLLSTITDAKPKIADYEFTTLKPNLGIVKYRDFRSFVMADIPGIIEGASQGKGIGLRFLRHIERNSILLFLISCDSNDILKNYKTLINELYKYNKELLDKKHAIAITKSDLIDEELKTIITNELKKEITVPLIFISSIAQKGIQELKDILWECLQ